MWDRTFNNLLDNVATAGCSLPVSAHPSAVSRQDRSINITQHYVFKGHLLQLWLRAVVSISSMVINSVPSVVFQPIWEHWSSACSLIRRTTVFIVLSTKQRYFNIIISISLSHQQSRFVTSLEWPPETLQFFSVYWRHQIASRHLF